jgi:uncharacterized RDD family membrane protein YckC
MTEPEFNPYSAPAQTDEEDFSEKRRRRRHVLATPGQRLAGHFVDALFLAGGSMLFLPAEAFVLFIPTNASLLLSGGIQESAYLPLLFFYACAAGLQWTLIARRGQTIGKYLVKSRIVRLGGSKPGFYHGVFLRSCLGYLPLALPIAGSLYALVDALFVFRRDRRTLRDLIAGTRVVQV